MLNTTLLNSAQAIINSASSTATQFNMTAEFMSSSAGSTFMFYPLEIDHLIINQDFADNFADEIDLTMTISLKDQALLQDQGQNLLCLLTLTYVDKYGNVVTTPAPIQKQYHVMINDPRDIRKAVPDVHLYTAPSQSVTVRLIEAAVYDSRQTKINAIYQNHTVTQTIYAIADALNINRLHLRTPDNSQTYDHMEIAGYQGLSSVFGYLQGKVGVYEKGVNGYVTGGTLYVYPAFDTDPKYDKTAIFYQVDKGRFTGSHSFHTVNGKTLSIVINEEVHSYDLSIAGAENVGTGFTFLRASRLGDGLTAIDSQNGAQFTESPALTVSLASSRTAIQGRQNIVHISPTDNPFPKMSDIQSHQASLAQVTWQGADPFQIDPPHSVIYYYDENGTMVKKTGMVEKSTYMIKKGQRSGPKYMYHCAGSLTLRLSPNETKVFSS